MKNKFLEYDDVAKIFYEYDIDMPVYDLLSYVKSYTIDDIKEIEECNMLDNLENKI